MVRLCEAEVVSVNQCNVFILSHRDPGRRIWDILPSLDTPARVPKKKCIELTEKGQHKGVDHLLCIREGQHGTSQHF